MRFNLFDLVIFEIDWKAIAFLSFAPMFVKLIDKML